MTPQVCTNHHWRPFVYRSDVPAAVLAEQFNYLPADDSFDGFFCYRGHWYHTSDFMRTDSGPLSTWDGYHSDSFFSGVVIKLSRDGERYKIGTYMS